MSILQHAGVVLAGLCGLTWAGWCNPLFYLLSFLYLCLVHENYYARLRRRLQFDARKQANQKKVLSDSETVNWLNHAVEKIWPICMEQVASQHFLLPIIPWFLDKYKPWTAKKAVVQHLYLGKNPPMFTDIRVLGQSNDDDHLVLELGMNFLSGDDMSAILAVQLRKRLGFGMWAKMHVTGMHVEGKVVVGVKFLRQWPFIGRIRVSFVEPPYFQMTVKPIFNHGIDVTELPGIAGWLDKLLSVAFEQSLVVPNMLVLDVEKFVSAPAEAWFTVDEKRPLAYAKVEIVEGVDLKPADMNGLSDPYVKGQLGSYRFRTKIQWKTLNPKWLEEFKIPINSWDIPNVLALEVRDKDRIFDDTLGDCTVDIGELRGGQRHDIWLALQNIKVGRLHLAITILEGENGDEVEPSKESVDLPKSDVDPPTSKQTDAGNLNPEASAEDSTKMRDEFEPIPIEGQEKTGVWVHHPGSNVSKKWEPRRGKGRVRHGDTELHGEELCSPKSAESVSTNSSEERQDGKKGHGGLAKIKRGFDAIGSAFGRSPRSEAIPPDQTIDLVTTPRPNLRAVGDKSVGVKLVVEDVRAEDVANDIVAPLLEKNGGTSMKKQGKTEKAKGILKSVLSRKISKKEKNGEVGNEDSSSDESRPSSAMMVEGVSMHSFKEDIPPSGKSMKPSSSSKILGGSK